MQFTIPVASAAKIPVFFPLKKDQSAATHLVACWLKDQDGRLYCTWVREQF